MKFVTLLINYIYIYTYKVQRQQNTKHTYKVSKSIRNSHKNIYIYIEMSRTNIDKTKTYTIFEDWNILYNRKFTRIHGVWSATVDKLSKKLLYANRTRTKDSY